MPSLGLASEIMGMVRHSIRKIPTTEQIGNCHGSQASGRAFDMTRRTSVPHTFWGAQRWSATLDDRSEPRLKCRIEAADRQFGSAAGAGGLVAVPGLARPGCPDPCGPRRPAGCGDRSGPVGSSLMEVVPLSSVDEVASLTADTIEALVRARPSCVLGLATGSSPVPAYAGRARHRAGTGPSYDEVRGFLLDEYVGLPPRAPAVLSRHHRPRADRRPGHRACPCRESPIRDVQRLRRNLTLDGIGKQLAEGARSDIAGRVRIASAVFWPCRVRSLCQVKTLTEAARLL